MPMNSLQAVCSPKCAISHGPELLRRHQRRDLRKAKAKLKTRAQWLKEAQRAFNAWVRERDRLVPCISCGRHHEGQYHAGHYRPSKDWALRFEPDNCHKQCMPCNTHLSGNLTQYRKALIEKIGLERVEWLDGPHEPAKWTIDDLKAIRDEYRQKLKSIKKPA